MSSSVECERQGLKGRTRHLQKKKEQRNESKSVRSHPTTSFCDANARSKSRSRGSCCSPKRFVLIHSHCTPSCQPTKGEVLHLIDESDTEGRHARHRAEFRNRRMPATYPSGASSIQWAELFKDQLLALFGKIIPQIWQPRWLMRSQLGAIATACSLWRSAAGRDGFRRLRFTGHAEQRFDSSLGVVTGRLKNLRTYCTSAGGYQSSD